MSPKTAEHTNHPRTKLYKLKQWVADNLRDPNPCETCGEHHTLVDMQVEPDGMYMGPHATAEEANAAMSDGDWSWTYHPKAYMETHANNGARPPSVIHQEGYDVHAPPHTVVVKWNPYVHQRENATMAALHEVGHVMQAQEDWDGFRHAARPSYESDEQRSIHSNPAFERDAFQKGVNIGRQIGMRITPDMMSSWRGSVGGEHLAGNDSPPWLPGDEYFTCPECEGGGCDDCNGSGLVHGLPHKLTDKEGTCRHCQRRIVYDENHGWVDPEATGGDRMWRETCDANEEDRRAAHEPEETTKQAAWGWLGEFKEAAGSTYELCASCLGTGLVTACPTCGGNDAGFWGQPLCKTADPRGRTALFDYDPVRDVQPSGGSAPAPSAQGQGGDPWPDQGDNGTAPPRSGPQRDKKLKKWIRDEQLTYPDVGPTFPGVTDINKVGMPRINDPGASVYHAAPSRLRDVIQNEGVIHGSDTRRYDWAPKGTYVWETEAQARNYALGEAGGYDEPFDVWEASPGEHNYTLDDSVGWGGLRTKHDAKLPVVRLIHTYHPKDANEDAMEEHDMAVEAEDQPAHSLWADHFSSTDINKVGTRYSRCQDCEGRGCDSCKFSGLSDKPCWDCGGTGIHEVCSECGVTTGGWGTEAVCNCPDGPKPVEVACDLCDSPINKVGSDEPQYEICEACGGDGQGDFGDGKYEKCEFCGGSGIVKRTKSSSITKVAGWVDDGPHEPQTLAKIEGRRKDWKRIAKKSNSTENQAWLARGAPLDIQLDQYNNVDDSYYGEGPRDNVFRHGGEKTRDRFNKQRAEAEVTYAQCGHCKGSGEPCGGCRGTGLVATIPDGTVKFPAWPPTPRSRKVKCRGCQGSGEYTGDSICDRHGRANIAYPDMRCAVGKEMGEDCTRRKWDPQTLSMSHHVPFTRPQSCGNCGGKGFYMSEPREGKIGSPKKVFYCDDCGGSGKEPDPVITLKEHTLSDGRVVKREHHEWDMQTWRSCKACKGSGLMDVWADRLCDDCGHQWDSSDEAHFETDFHGNCPACEGSNIQQIPENSSEGHDPKVGHKGDSYMACTMCHGDPANSYHKDRNGCVRCKGTGLLPNTPYNHTIRTLMEQGVPVYQHDGLSMGKMFSIDYNGLKKPVRDTGTLDGMSDEAGLQFAHADDGWYCRAYRGNPGGTAEDDDFTDGTKGGFRSLNEYDNFDPHELVGFVHKMHDRYTDEFGGFSKTSARYELCDQCQNVPTTEADHDHHGEELWAWTKEDHLAHLIKGHYFTPDLTPRPATSLSNLWSFRLSRIHDVAHGAPCPDCKSTGIRLTQTFKKLPDPKDGAIQPCFQCEGTSIEPEGPHKGEPCLMCRGTGLVNFMANGYLDRMEEKFGPEFRKRHEEKFKKNASGLDPTGYVYEADTHCTQCAEERFGKEPGHAWVRDDARDSEGNEIGAMFATDGLPTPEHCGSCGANFCTKCGDREVERHDKLECDSCDGEGKFASTPAEQPGYNKCHYCDGRGDDKNCWCGGTGIVKSNGRAFEPEETCKDCKGKGYHADVWVCGNCSTASQYDENQGFKSISTRTRSYHHCIECGGTGQLNICKNCDEIYFASEGTKACPALGRDPHFRGPWTAHEPNGEKATCGDCEGAGLLLLGRRRGQVQPVYGPCGDCKGTGRTKVGTACWECRGSGLSADGNTGKPIGSDWTPEEIRTDAYDFNIKAHLRQQHGLINILEKCSNCKGKGLEPNGGGLECQDCGGHGKDFDDEYWRKMWHPSVHDPEEPGVDGHGNPVTVDHEHWYEYEARAGQHEAQVYPQQVGDHQADNGIEDPITDTPKQKMKKIIPGTQKTVPETNNWNVSVDNLPKTGAAGEWTVCGLCKGSGCWACRNSGIAGKMDGETATGWGGPCRYCREPIIEVTDDHSGVYDYVTEGGDYGCFDNPISGEDGTGCHYPTGKKHPGIPDDTGRRDYMPKDGKVKTGQAQQPATSDDEESEEPEQPKISDLQAHVMRNHPMMAEEIASIDALEELSDLELDPLHIQDHAMGQNDHNPEVLRVASVPDDKGVYVCPSCEGTGRCSWCLIEEADPGFHDHDVANCPGDCDGCKGSGLLRKKP